MNISTTARAAALIRSILDTSRRTHAAVTTDEKKPLLEAALPVFPRVTPEECGISSAEMLDFMKRLDSDCRIGWQNITFMRGGKVFYEASKGEWRNDIPKTTFSACKSIVSLAVGRLVTEKRLRLNERVADILSEYTSAITAVRLKGLTVEDLLTMRSTVTFNEAEATVTREWRKAFLASTTNGTVGKTFFYNSLNTYMLAAIVVKRSGMSLCDYLDTTVFGELGITDYYWEKSPEGIEKGGWGLYILPEDMLKLGKLILDKGRHRGKRIISESYLAAATSTQAIAPEDYGEFNYGYQIWCGRTNGSFLFNGMLGQNLLCFRENGIEIMINAGNGDNFQQNPFFALALGSFCKAFPDTLPENREAYDELCGYTKGLESLFSPDFGSILPAPDEEELPCTLPLSALYGRSFAVSGANAPSTGILPLFIQAVESNYTHGLERISFSEAEGGIAVTFTEADCENTVIAGDGHPVEGVVALHGDMFRVSAHARFARDEDGAPVLTVTCAYLETPYRAEYKFHFGSRPFAVFSETPGPDYVSVVPKIIAKIAAEKQLVDAVYSKIDRDYIAAKLEKAFRKRIELNVIS